MGKSSKNQFFLKTLACLGQLASLFPFAVFFETHCIQNPAVWHFFVIYAVWLVFRSAGWLVEKLCGSLQKRRLPKKLIPFINFLSRIGFVIPLAAFIALGVWLRPDPAVYFYILPAGIIIYFGGNLSVGRSYSDIYTKSWFALYMISAVVSMLMSSMTENTGSSSAAVYVLCVGFAVVILISAVLANQTNIDTRTNQRDAGKAVLPKGLRRYNALLVIGIFTLTIGAFVFAKPIADVLKSLIKAIAAAFLYLFAKLSSLFPDADETFRFGETVGGDPVLREPDGSGGFGTVISAVMMIALIVFVIAFRKQIIGLIKSLLEPLFRSRSKASDTPFADEITSCGTRQSARRAQKKTERDLERQYAHETSPERKYRLGYALFLARLRRTGQPPALSDTTDVHREKGERAFGEDLRDFSETYNKVRYAGITPTAEELAAENELLRKIK